MYVHANINSECEKVLKEFKRIVILCVNTLIILLNSVFGMDIQSLMFSNYYALFVNISY